MIRTQQRRNGDTFCVEIEATTGFFAVMQLALFILMHCDRQGLAPVISARGGLYGEPSRSVDWFAELFAAKAMARRHRRSRPVHVSHVRSVADLGFRDRYERELTLRMASALFDKYYAIQPRILELVDAWCRELQVSTRTLAVHYRGTDKASEARRVPLPEVVAAVRRALATHQRLDSILVASDEGQFIADFRGHDFGVPVRIAPALHLSRNGKPVHFAGYDGLAIGREALMTCALLSRCGVLIKTASYLSAWAKILNPGLVVWLLSDSRFFPDHALWRAQQDEARG